jgi:uncharacterized spore protein YtfJ
MADWEDAPVKTSQWEDAPKQVAPVPGRQEERQKQATKRLGPQDILAKTGESAGYGAALGAISPELTMGAGGLMFLSPYTATFAPTVISTGEAMRGARLAEAGLGLLSGGATEFTEDVSKQAGASTGVSKALGFGAGMTPYALPSVVKGIASKLTGISKESIKELVDKLPKTIESIEAGTETQKQKAKQVAVDLLKKAGATDKDLQPLYDIFYGAAKDIEGKGKAALSQAEAEANRLTQLAEQSGRAEDWQKAVPQLKSAVGQPRELSEIGTSLREPIVANNQAALAKRSGDYKTLEATRDKVLADKEAAGQFIENTTEYKTLVKELNEVLKPQGRAAKETDPGVIKAFQDLKQAITPQTQVLTEAQAKAWREKGVSIFEGTNPQTGEKVLYRKVPPSFNAIDTVRRRLGDAAFGKEAEGYAALKGNLAQDWYFKLSKMQENFAGESQKALQNTYKEHSGWLDKYKAQLGKRVTALDRFDETKFAADAKSLPDSFFSSQQSVRDLLQLTNDKNLVNKAASDYAARSMGETVESAQAFKKKNSEMLKELPDVARKVDNYIQQLQRGELAVSKGEARAKQFTEQGKEVLEKGTQQAKDAQAIADKLLGDKFPAERIKQFLQTGSPQEWERIAPYIAQTPQGKDVLAKGLAAALGDEISGLAVTKSGSIGAIFKDKIAPGLRATKLMDEKKINLIESQLKRIYESNQTPAAKQSLATKLIANAVRGQAATGLTAGTDFIFNLNQTGK